MTTYDPEEISDYKTQALEFLEKSQDYLLVGDLHQASEKGWGAASHMAKAVAAALGWRYETHAEFGVVLSEIGKLTENEEDRRNLRLFRAVANGLHQNYYSRKRHLDATAIGEDLDDDARLLDLLAPWAEPASEPTLPEVRYYWTASPSSLWYHWRLDCGHGRAIYDQNRLEGNEPPTNHTACAHCRRLDQRSQE